MSVPHFPLLDHPLSYPQGKAIHPCPLLLTRQQCTKKKKKSLAICVRGHCNLTLDARLHVAACEKTKAGKATRKMWRRVKKKKKKS